MKIRGGEKNLNVFECFKVTSKLRKLHNKGLPVIVFWVVAPLVDVVGPIATT
jgi:hypothetical protein